MERVNDAHVAVRRPKRVAEHAGRWGPLLGLIGILTAVALIVRRDGEEDAGMIRSVEQKSIVHRERVIQALRTGLNETSVKLPVDADSLNKTLVTLDRLRSNVTAVRRAILDARASIAHMRNNTLVYRSGIDELQNEVRRCRAQRQGQVVKAGSKLLELMRRRGEVHILERQ